MSNERERLLKELYRLMPGTWRRCATEAEFERWKTEAGIVLDKFGQASAREQMDDLKHAVSCMDRSCKRCNSLKESFEREAGK